MNCMYCGASAGHEAICPKCGQDLSVQKKAMKLSNLYYNMGLDKAQIRDLSGAIDLLERSLKYNKTNLAARNLLGLIYFETGEVVSALTEWVISKNLKPDDNIASHFIERVQADPDKLDTIHQTIKRYNMALAACRDGNEDVAEIMLKKVIAANPRLIKALHLLSLIYIKNKDWKQARKILQKAATIDRTNSTTLRFMKEIDEQTHIEEEIAVSASASFSGSEKNIFKRVFGKKRKGFISSSSTLPDDFWESENLKEENRQAQPLIFNMLPAFAGVMYVILGLILGVLVVWFIAVPAVKQQVARESNDKIATYSEELAGETRQIESLENTIAENEATISDVNEQLAAATAKSAADEALFQAYFKTTSGDVEGAVKSMDAADEAVLTDYGKFMKQNLTTSLSAAAFTIYFNAGKTAFDGADYTTAITELTKAKALKPTDYDTLSYLAHSYRLAHNLELATAAFNEILTLFPADASAVSTAQHYLELLAAGDFGDGTTTSTATASAAAGTTTTANAAQAEEQTTAQQADESDESEDYDDYEESDDDSNENNNDEEEDGE